MYKILACALMFVSFNALAEEACYSDYLNKGLVEGATTSSLNCYLDALGTKTTNLEKANILNRIAYLQFLLSEESDNKSQRRSMQKAAKGSTERAIAFYGEGYDYETYASLPEADREVLSKTFYLDGVLLSRISEEKGGLTVVNNWPKIQRIMKLVMRLGYPETEFFGAYRTLAIAHTRMPAFLADRELAFRYFTLSIQRTDIGEGRSALIINNILFADLLFKMDRDEDACQQLKLASETTEEQILQNAPEHVSESLGNIEDAKARYQDKCL